MMTINKSNFA